MFQAKHDGITVGWWNEEGYWFCQRVMPGKKRTGSIGVGKTKDESFANWKAVYDLEKAQAVRGGDGGHSECRPCAEAERPVA